MHMRGIGVRVMGVSAGQTVAGHRVIHIIAYTARDGSGVAQVHTSRTRPTWAECAAAVPGFVTGSYLGVALHARKAGK